MDVTKLLAVVILVSVLAGLWFFVTDTMPEPVQSPKKKSIRKKTTPKAKKKK